MKILVLVLGTVAALQFGSGEHKTHLCEGFVPKNDRSYPVGMKSPFMNAPSGITEEEFVAAMDRLETFMSHDVAEHGGRLIINRLWTSTEVNAYAWKGEDPTEWNIDMHGGLARHPAMTADAYILIGCHEVGHHVGGFPLYTGDNMSTEGQSDYYAASKCFRRLFSLKENTAWVRANDVDPVAAKECKLRFSSPRGTNACIRTAHAGLVLGRVLQDLNGELAEPQLSTPDTRKVVRTHQMHPKSQCRVDTYFNGGLCTRRSDSHFKSDDYRPGSCEKVDGYKFGFRPRCWFAPTDPDPVLIDQVAAM